jgi:hypothetical protein
VAAAVVATVAIVVGALILLVSRVFAPAPPPTLSSRLSRIVLDDDFSLDRGWDKSSDGIMTPTLFLGHPGALDLSVTAPHRVYHAFAPTIQFPEVKFTATMLWNSGGGSAGLSCQTDEHGGYEFRLNASGVEIDREPGNASGIASTTLRRSAGPHWAPGRRATITAVCAAGDAVASDVPQGDPSVALQLWVDGKSVLEASDTYFAGPFTPAVFLDGPVDLDVTRFAVYTTPVS